MLSSILVKRLKASDIPNVWPSFKDTGGGRGDPFDYLSLPYFDLSRLFALLRRLSTAPLSDTDANMEDQLGRNVVPIPRNWHRALCQTGD